MNLLYGLILCGGKSSRLGIPKFKIEYNGVALYKWWINTLDLVCEKTYISCQHVQMLDIEYPYLLLDESTDAGPLEGIYKAFQLNNKVNWLVIACDLVYADIKDINNLVENNKEGIDAISYMNQETEEPYSLFTIYNSQIQALLQKEYRSDLKSAKRLLMNSNTLKLIPKNPLILKGINTAEELNIWKAWHFGLG